MAYPNEQLAVLVFLRRAAYEINNPLAAIVWSAEYSVENCRDFILSGHDDFDPEDTRSTLAGNLQVIEGSLPMQGDYRKTIGI